MDKNLFTVEEQIMNIGGERVYTGNMFEDRGLMGTSNIEFNLDWVETKYTILIGDYIIMDEVGRDRVEKFFNSLEYKDIASKWSNVLRTTESVLVKLFIGKDITVGLINPIKVASKMVTDVFTKVILEGIENEVDMEKAVIEVISKKLLSVDT